MKERTIEEAMGLSKGSKILAMCSEREVTIGVVKMKKGSVFVYLWRGNEKYPFNIVNLHCELPVLSKT